MLQDDVFARVQVVDVIAEHPDARGFAKWSGPICFVWIKREYYPACLKHEIRHCFEGNWHEGRETVWDCD